MALGLGGGAFGGGRRWEGREGEGLFLFPFWGEGGGPHLAPTTSTR